MKYFWDWSFLVVLMCFCRLVLFVLLYWWCNWNCLSLFWSLRSWSWFRRSWLLSWYFVIVFWWCVFWFFSGFCCWWLRCLVVMWLLLCWLFLWKILWCCWSVINRSEKMLSRLWFRKMLWYVLWKIFWLMILFVLILFFRIVVVVVLMVFFRLLVWGCVWCSIVFVVGLLISVVVRISWLRLMLGLVVMYSWLWLIVWLCWFVVIIRVILILIYRSWVVWWFCWCGRKILRGCRIFCLMNFFLGGDGLWCCCGDGGWVVREGWFWVFCEMMKNVL